MRKHSKKWQHRSGVKPLVSKYAAKQRGVPETSPMSPEPPKRFEEVPCEPVTTKHLPPQIARPRLVPRPVNGEGPAPLIDYAFYRADADARANFVSRCGACLWRLEDPHFDEQYRKELRKEAGALIQEVMVFINSEEVRENWSWSSVLALSHRMIELAAHVSRMRKKVITQVRTNYHGYEMPWFLRKQLKSIDVEHAPKLSSKTSRSEKPLEKKKPTRPHVPAVAQALGEAVAAVR